MENKSCFLSERKLLNLAQIKNYLARMQQQKKYVLVLNGWIAALIDCEKIRRYELLLPKYESKKYEAIQVGNKFILMKKDKIYEIDIKINTREISFAEKACFAQEKVNIKCFSINDIVYIINDFYCEKWSSTKNKLYKIPDTSSAFANSRWDFMIDNRYIISIINPLSAGIFDILDEEAGWKTIDCSYCSIENPIHKTSLDKNFYYCLIAEQMCYLLLNSKCLFDPNKKFSRDHADHNRIIQKGKYIAFTEKYEGLICYNFKTHKQTSISWYNYC